MWPHLIAPHRNLAEAEATSFEDDLEGGIRPLESGKHTIARPVHLASCCVGGHESWTSRIAAAAGPCFAGGQ